MRKGEQAAVGKRCLEAADTKKCFVGVAIGCPVCIGGL